VSARNTASTLSAKAWTRGSQSAATRACSHVDNDTPVSVGTQCATRNTEREGANTHKTRTASPSAALSTARTAARTWVSRSAAVTPGSRTEQGEQACVCVSWRCERCLESGPARGPGQAHAPTRCKSACFTRRPSSSSSPSASSNALGGWGGCAGGGDDEGPGVRGREKQSADL